MRSRAVVHDEAVFAQHQAIAHFPDRQRREHVDVDAIEECARIRALDVDLAERRDITNADARAHRRDFACHGFEPVLFAGPANHCARSHCPASTNVAPRSLAQP